MYSVCVACGARSPHRWVVLHAGVLWGWHLPAPFEAALALLAAWLGQNERRARAAPSARERPASIW